MPTDIFLSNPHSLEDRPVYTISLGPSSQVGHQPELINLHHPDTQIQIRFHGPAGRLQHRSSLGDHHVYVWGVPGRPAVIGNKSRFWWLTLEEMEGDVGKLAVAATVASVIGATAQLEWRPGELSVLLSTAELNESKFFLPLPPQLQRMALASAADVAKAKLRAQEEAEFGKDASVAYNPLVGAISSRPDPDDTPQTQLTAEESVDLLQSRILRHLADKYDLPLGSIRLQRLRQQVTASQPMAATENTTALDGDRSPPYPVMTDDTDERDLKEGSEGEPRDVE